MGSHLQLEDLLVSLNSEGQHDSSGAFTIDDRSALERLAKFQLVDPYQYCLRWLQAAVAGGASYFNWHGDSHQCYAEIGDYVIEPGQIHQLPTVMLDGRARRSERHVSAGLNAVLRTYAKQIRLRSGNHLGTWTHGKFQIESREMGMNCTKIEVEFVPLSREKRLFAPARKEAELLHAQACVPISLSVGPHAPRRRLEKLANFYGARLKEFWIEAKGQQGFLPPPFRAERNYPRCRLYLARLDTTEEVFPSLFYGVRDGEWLTPRPISDVTNVVGFADVSHLQADLTGLQMVEDSDYLELRAELQRCLFKVM
ncbi:hypothetical protein JST97_06385 [bacterium]|nr:hypothetical protein [bacterium]